MKDRIIKRLFVSVVAMTFGAALAQRTDCPEAKVDFVQVEGQTVLYSQSGTWRTLGSIGDEGTKYRYAALLSASLSGAKVVVGYPVSNFNCGVTNWTAHASVVRVVAP